METISSSHLWIIKTNKGILCLLFMQSLKSPFERISSLYNFLRNFNQKWIEIDLLTPIREFWTKNPISGNWASVIFGQNIQQKFLNGFWDLNRRHFWTKYPDHFSERVPVFLSINDAPWRSQNYVFQKTRQTEYNHSRWIFRPEMTLPDVSKRIWIFCPKMTLAQFPK